MTSDDRLREALDRTLAGLRVSLEEEVRALVRDVIDTTIDERRRTTAARETDELGRLVPPRPETARPLDGSLR